MAFAERDKLRELIENERYHLYGYENDNDEIGHLLDLPLTLFDNQNKPLVIESYLTEAGELSLKSLLSDKQYEKILSIKSKSVIAEESEKRRMALALVDIVLAFLYDWRVTEFETNCESNWTINKLSGVLSCFVEFEVVNDLLICFYRRALTFPLYRNIDLCQIIIKDLTLILRAGKRFLLKILLEVHRIFDLNSPKYLLNRIYIDDFCVWVQKTDEAIWTKMATEVEAVNSQIAYEDLRLPDIEADSVEDEETEQGNTNLEEVN